MAHQKAELIHPVRRNLVQETDIDLVLQEMGIGRCAGKSGASGVLIFRRPVLVGISDPELIAVGEIVKYTSRSKKMVRGVGKSLRKRTKTQRFGGGQGIGIDDVLLVENVLVERQQETGPLAMAERASHRAFVVLPALRRLHQGKRIAGVKDRITEHEIQGAVIVPSSALGYDLQPCPPGPREPGRVRI